VTFERGMVVNARLAGLNILEAADLLWFSRTLWFAANSQKQKNISREWSKKREKIQWVAVL